MAQAETKTQEDKDTVASHYNKQKKYNNHFFYKDVGYKNFLLESIASEWPVNATSFADVGCGTGNFTVKLIRKQIASNNNNNVQHKCYCVDPIDLMYNKMVKFMGEKEQSDINKSCEIIPILASGESFIESISKGKIQNWSPVDVILFKEVLHHVQADELKLMLERIYKYKMVKPGGKIISMTRSGKFSKEYPLPEATKKYALTLRSMDFYENLWKQVFGDKNAQLILKKYKIKILAKEWIEMLNNRFWTILERLTEDEIQESIIQIKKFHNIKDENKDYIVFYDTIALFEATMPNNDSKL